MKLSPFPAELISTAAKFLTGPFFGIDAEYAFCTKNGFLMELKGNIPRNICKISITDVCDMELTYKWKDGNCQCFYVLHSTSGDLLVVDRSRPSDKIIEKRRDVSRFEIADVLKKGQAQLLVWKEDTIDPEILLGDDCGPYEDSQEDVGNSVVPGYLETAWMEMKSQRESLKEELYLKKDLVQRQLSEKLPRAPCDAVPVVGRITGDSLPPTMPSPCVELRDSWQHVHADLWIIGLTLNNTSSRDILNIQIVPKDGKNWEYRYKVLLDTKSDPWNFALGNLIPSGSLFYITVMMNLANVWDDSHISRQFEVRCLEDWVTTPLFTITPCQLLLGRMDFFANTKCEKGSLRKDFISLLQSHTMSKLHVEVPVPTALKSLQSIVVEDLRMKKLQRLGRGYFYSNRGPLDGVLILCTSPPQALKQILRIWVREIEQIFLFVSGLYDLLPYGTTIKSFGASRADT